MGLKCRQGGAAVCRKGQGESKQQDLQWRRPAQSPQGPSSGVSDHRMAQTAVGRGFSALVANSLKTHGGGGHRENWGSEIMGEGYCSIPNPSHTPE